MINTFLWPVVQVEAGAAVPVFEKTKLLKTHVKTTHSRTTRSRESSVANVMTQHTTQAQPVNPT
jgi:hypothetical protein